MFEWQFLIQRRQNRVNEINQLTLERAMWGVQIEVIAFQSSRQKHSMLLLWDLSSCAHILNDFGLFGRLPWHIDIKPRYITINHSSASSRTAWRKTTNDSATTVFLTKPCGGTLWQQGKTQWNADNLTDARLFYPPVSWISLSSWRPCIV